MSSILPRGRATPWLTRAGASPPRALAGARDHGGGEHPSADVIAGIFTTDWHAELAGDLKFKDGDDPEALADQGETLVRLYVAEHQDLRVQAVEWPFEIPLADPVTGEVLGPNLRGVFDLLLADDVLVELKTAAKAYSESQLTTGLQFSAYAMAYRAIVGRDPKIQVVAMIKNAKKPRIDRYEVRRSPEDDAWFVHVAVEVSRGIEAGVFPPSPGWACGDCEYAEPCRAWRGPSVQIRAGVVRLPVVAEARP